MTQYDNTNRGVLFKNDRKQKDTHPDYNGTININGTEHYLSAWVKQGKSGMFMSLSIGKIKEHKPQGESQFKQEDLNDDIPF